MKVSSVQLTKQALVYLCTKKKPWYTIGIALLVAMVFSFGAKVQFDLYEHYAYWKAILQNFVRFYWRLWVVNIVFVDITNKRRSVLRTAYDAFMQTCSVWWLIVWIVLLQKSLFVLLQKPYWCSESIDLVLLIVVTCIHIVHIGLDFFLLPSLAAGARGFKKLLLDAFTSLVCCMGTLIAFAFLFLVVICFIFFSIGAIVVLLHKSVEVFVIRPWFVDFFKTLWFYSAGGILLAFLATAQALLYVRIHKIAE